MKLEVGMFIRTEYGIRKITEDIGWAFDFDQSIINEYGDFEDCFDKKYQHLYVTKASYNIIDILEVGDYVNESIVLGFENKYIEEDDKFVPIGVITENCYLDNNKSWIIEKDIKTIVTKEEFKLMAYKVGE